MIKVLLVDDQTLVRQGIRGLLEISEDVRVTAEAEDGMEAFTAVTQHEPDIVLLDLRMPRHDGIWALEAMRDNGIDVPVLVLTTFDDDELVMRALSAGAKGYLLKDVTLEQLVDAVKIVASGQTLVQPAITDRLLRAIREGGNGDTTELPAQPLTERELDVLRLMASGYGNRQIAEALFLAEGTVKNHVSSLLLKLAVKDRTSAVLRALQDGILN